MKVTISNSAAQVIGLDDFARYPDLKRSWTKRFVVVEGEILGIKDLITELYDRATEGSDGYDESSSNKAVCRRAYKRAIQQLDSLTITD